MTRMRGCKSQHIRSMSDGESKCPPTEKPIGLRGRSAVAREHGLVGINKQFAGADGGTQPKWRLRAIGENAPQEHRGLARELSVNRNGGDQVRGYVFLLKGACGEHKISLPQEF